MGFNRNYFFFSSRRRHTIYWRDWSSDVCSSDLRRVVPDLAAERLSSQGLVRCPWLQQAHVELQGWAESFSEPRSEERRVGKECRSRWSPYHEKKNTDGWRSDTRVCGNA